MSSAMSKPKIDLLLIYPPWTVLYTRSVLTNALPPLGILSIASYCEQQGFVVRVVDVHAERISPDQLREKISEMKPRFCGICVLSSMIVASHAIARDVKTIVPSCKVIFGGVHPELFPERVLRNSAVDYVVRGDGEETTLALLKGVDAGKILGLSYRGAGNRVVSNPAQEIVMDIDKYPMPAYHLIQMDKYFPSATSYKNLPAANMIMTRGCPGKCSFCNSANTVLRSRSPMAVFRQIKELREKYGVRQIQFFDDTFTVNKKGVLELCSLLREDKTDITFSCYARGDCFNDEIAAALKSAGCHQIMVGIETGSEKIARVIQKPINKSRYYSLMKTARKYGMEVRAGFIIGSLGETWETMQESLDFAIDLDVDFFQLSVSTPYPGTQLFKQALEEGRLESLDFKYYGQSLSLVRLDDLSADDLRKFERHAWRRFYLRPKVVFRQLARLTNLRQVKDLFNALNLLYSSHRSSKIPKWQEWDEAQEDSFLDIDAVQSSEDLKRLTFQVRKTWEEMAA